MTWIALAWIGVSLVVALGYRFGVAVGRRQGYAEALPRRGAERRRVPAV